MRNRTIILLTLVVLISAGCGKNAISVTGKVTYNGQPVEQGTISFQPADGMGQVFAARIENGTYNAPNAIPGNRVVLIRGVKKVKVSLTSEESARTAAEAYAEGNTGGLHVAEAADYIPKDAEGNNKTVEIASGDQTINFDVKGPPRK